MKHLSLFLLLIFNLHAATIDTKLFEDAHREHYYDEIKKQISEEKGENVKDELFQLNRVREASQKKIEVSSINLKVLKQKNVKVSNYFNLINETSQLNNKLEKNSKITLNLQSKIAFLKNLIENITENEKSKLLSHQLQFAYYKIEQKNIEQKQSLLKKEIENVEKALLKSFTTLNCNEVIHLEQELTKLEEKIQSKQQEIIVLDLKKEKALIDDNTLTSAIENEILLKSRELQQLLSEKISIQLKQSICLLKKKSSSEFYTIINAAKESTETLSDANEKNIHLYNIDMIKKISKSTLGSTQILFGATLEESKLFLHSLKEFLFAPLFIFNERPISIFSLFKAILYVIIGFILAYTYTRWIKRVTLKFNDISLMSVRLMSNIGYYLIILIFFIISISSLGIDMSSLSLIAGALSIGIGFGLQTIVSNLFAGIILMFERTIRIGDVIEISDTIVGTVTDMRIRSTTIKTYDNIDVVIPNSTFIQNNVINMTLEDKIRRLHIPFGVAYGSEISEVKEVILDALSKSDLHFIRNDEERTPDVRMTLMNSSSVDLELIVWVNRDSKLKISLPSDFMILIYNTLRANNISIPFPQIDVHMQN